MRKIIRITRHQPDAERVSFLKRVYGEDCEIITHDFPYGSDPVATVHDAIKAEAGVVAIEAIAPFPVLIKLVDARTLLGVTLLRAEFRRDGTGRAIVTGKDAEGRDILAFDRYTALERITFEIRELV